MVASNRVRRVIMSNNGVPIQDIADTVGHKSTYVTKTVCRHVIAPAIRGPPGGGAGSPVAALCCQP
jgi:hypothetical protein